MKFDSSHVKKMRVAELVASTMEQNKPPSGIGAWERVKDLG